MKTFEPSTVKNTPRMPQQFRRETHQGKTALSWLALPFSVIFCLASASPVSAQALNVTIAGLNCTANQFSALSFSWGAVNAGVSTGSSTGGAVGKATISTLNVSKAFDGCSPALFRAAVTGGHYSTLTLVQQDKKNVALMTVTLSEVFVQSIQWSGSAGDAQTAENVAFDFAKVCIQDGPSGNKVCYDRLMNTTF